MKIRVSVKTVCFLAILISAIIFSTYPALATEAVGSRGRYQVVTGTNDQAYLLDTHTGMVWVLTFRTLPTGREPVAVPFKFIKISPKNQGEILTENIPGTGAVMEEKKSPGKD